MTHDPTEPCEVPDELRAEIEKIFEGVALVPDDELVTVVEALHAFLDAWGGEELHDRLITDLMDIIHNVDPTSPEAVDRLRDWIKKANDELQQRMLAIGLKTSSILVFHASTVEIQLWTMGADTHSD